MSSFENGYDNIWHNIVIEWIESSTERGGVPQVISRLVVDDIQNILSIGEVKFIKIGKKNFIIFEAVNSCMPEIEAVFLIDLVNIGKVQITKNQDLNHKIDRTSR